MNAEAVGEAKNLPLGQPGLDRRLVKISLGLIRSEYLKPIRFLGRFGWRKNRKSISFRLLGTWTGWVEPDDHVVAAVAQVLSLGVPLAAVAEHCNSLFFQGRGIGVALVKDSCHDVGLL